MKNRLLTAVVGIPIAIVCIIFADTVFFNIAVAAVTMIMVNELLNAEKCWDFKAAAVLCMAFAGLTPILSMPFFSEVRFAVATLFVFSLFLIYIAMNKSMSFDKICYMLVTTALASYSMSCMILLNDMDEKHGVVYVILSMFLPWISDAGAFFVGSAIGKHKLCPNISPKKTVEGAVGGLIITVISGVLFGLCYSLIMQKLTGEIITVNYVVMIFLSVACAVLAIIGDMAASLLKRQCSIKDYGSIMPGHGGVLDRFDSVLFVLPFLTAVFTYGLVLFN